MKLDPIVKEELWRSTAIFFISVIIVAVVITTGPFPIPAFLLFPLALAITAVFFCVMVWYRRKENLADPNPISILHHALRPGERREEKTQQRRGAVDKVVDAVLAVVIFLIYLYASRAYSINQVLWLPVLLIIGMFLARIVFTDGGEHRVTLTRSVVFYLLAAGIVLLRRLALGYPVIPTLQGVILVGIITFPILYVWERRRGQEVVD
ncbi:hypothetical protein MBBA_1226 [Methanoculleus bourgensis]|uniref:hypothetical protein n=1 Tax=Methanoculleus bourgensis TaxID=83986 RepID=UPI0007BCB138|nr:hypothetical protein MBBA_1226 [Methanoculleus bourgensis]